MPSTSPNEWRLLPSCSSDQALCQNTVTTAEPFDPLPKVKLDQGKLLTAEQVAKLASYKHYQFSPNGVSPRAARERPGVYSQVTGNEHNEMGHVSVNPVNRVKMMHKRMEKMTHARDDLPAARVYGAPTAQVGFIGYGSTWGPIREAQATLERQGDPNAILPGKDPIPRSRPRALGPFLESVDVAYIVEHNYTGQFARLIRETVPHHHAKLKSILRFDGFSFRAPDIVSQVKEA